MGPILAFLSGAWSFVGGAVKSAAGFFADLPRWLQVSIVAVAALILWTWWIGQHEYDRGLEAQKASDAKEIAQLSDSVMALQAGIAQANAAAATAQSEAKAAEAKAAAAVTAKLADVEKARKAEARRGSGADQMNRFMEETFGAAQ